MTSSATPDDAIKAGLAHHYAGRLAEAEALYRRVHESAPDHPDALHLLGMIAYQTGRARAATDLIGRAIAIAPSRAEFHRDLGDVLQSQGRADDAIAAYRAALAQDADPVDLCETHFALGNAFAGSRRPDDAAASYRAALALRPDHADASNNLAVVLQQQGRRDEAVAVLREAIARAPDSADLFYNLGNAQRDLGQLDEAEASYRRAIALQPKAAVAHFNLASVLQTKRQWADAAEHYGAAVAIHPAYADAHYGLGLARGAQGRPREAIAAFEAALVHLPAHLAARGALAQALAEDGRLDEAAAAFRAILAMKPDAADAQRSLGVVLHARGRPGEAEHALRRAIELAPNDARAHCDLGNALRAQGRGHAALTSYLRALQLHESDEFKAALADCLRGCRFTADDAGVRALVTRALAEVWVRPADLARLACDLVALTPGIAECVARADAAWPERLDGARLFGPSGLAAMGDDALLRVLLLATPVCSLALERCLTSARRALLAQSEAATPDTAPAPGLLAFHLALAAQCFIDEYVFAPDDDELSRASSLRERLAAALARGERVPPRWIASVATYFPLSTVAGIESADDGNLPPAVKALLLQQVREPAAERADRASVPALTPVGDGVSQRVREQYEESPYPRWMRLRPPDEPVAVDTYVRQQLPAAPLEPVGRAPVLDVLVAGCGTGQEAIETAQQLAGARVLAIDLSLSSLCYARRKTAETKSDNIEYAQADIVNLDAAGRSFDVVSSVGVLHHLADPAAGLAALASCLRPGGMMRLGLYSERARRDVVAARAFIAAGGYSSSAADIRRCRQDLVAAGGEAARVAQFRDFYSTSECRDLLFHVQEHRFDTGAIGALVAATGLRFLGFVVDGAIRGAYRQRFPQDAAMTDLAAWSEFEAALPDTFLGMYVFWVQKPSA